jgi:hypothetical protein
MNAEFNWWLLIVGLVVGAGLVWLVLADWSRREEDLSEDERSAESAWIADALRERGERFDPDDAAEILALHREYLRRTATTGPSDDADIEAIGAADVVATDDAPPAAETPEALTPGVARITADAEPTDRAARPAAAEAAPTTDRPSVRASRMSPRGTTGGLESEPPS